MRTPNAACIICAKPLYRRPNELAKVRYAACMAHRAQAQSVVGVTDAQAKGLSAGRVKGTNHRAGYRHRDESKAKASASHKLFCAANPEMVEARAAKRRGPLAYNWKGGASRLNVAIRQMRDSRKWMDAVKARDGVCLRCGSTEDLEAHHKVELAELLARLNVCNSDDARRHKAILFDLDNGETLCRRCHYAHHGRAFNEAA